MKTILITLLAFCSIGVMGQETQSTGFAEVTYLLPKMGHSSELETALTAHNEKYHANGPNAAFVRYIDYGDMAGWYSWIMTGTLSTLDARPNDDKHTKDWAESIEPHLQKYGSTRLWTNTDMATGDAMGSSKRFRAWMVHVKPGQNYRYNAIMKKMIETHESIGSTMIILSNRVNSKKAPDFQMIWPFNSFAEWDEQSGIPEAFEKLHGQGSWVPFLDEWRDIVEGVDAEIRSVL